MSRVKHALMLAFKLVFIVLCFVVVSVFTSLKNSDAGVFNSMKGNVGLDSCDIGVMDSSFDDIGASLTYEIVDGKIIFDLVQSGENFDDVCVWMTYPDFKYDASEMREYLQETLGDSADEEEYLTAMESGPWNCKYSFVLTGDETAVDYNNVVYTIGDPFMDEYTAVFKSENNAEKTVIEDLYVEKGENLNFLLIFGSESNGALPSGRYVFDADFGVSGLYYDDVDLSFGSKMDIIASTVVYTIKDNGIGIFNIENWLVFYGAMIIFGMFVYLWRDLQSLKKIFGAMLEERHPPVRVIIKVYVNGFITDQYSYIDDGTSMLGALLVTILCYVLFLLTYPLRILIHIVRDIIYLIKEDEEAEGFSIIGNLLGSVGVYAAMYGVLGLLGGNTVLGIIFTVVGVGACVGAHFICRNHEEEYG